MTTELSFGKYDIVERLGSGGMAEVYKCRLSGIGGFDKLVVIKRILPERMEEPDFVHMFLDEARIAANLNHPNIIHIFEVDELDGAPYMAMEYVRGPTMLALMRTAYRQKMVHLGHMAKLISGICAGLYYVHNARDQNGVPLEIIHRDISPQNILVSVEGVPKLLDFGVAKAVGRLAQTEAGMFKGKLRYTAPDQVRGLPVDHRSDIYSVGVCLYEATTGRQRFTSNMGEAQMMAAVMDGRIEPPSAVVPNYPPELERIVMWALEPDPTTRCPNAQALHQALEQFVSSGPHASSTQGLAQWIKELFPVSETQSYGRTLSTTTVGPMSAQRSLGGESRPGSNSSIRNVRTNPGSSSGKRRLAEVPPPAPAPAEDPETQVEQPGSKPSSKKAVTNAVMSMGVMIALLMGGAGAAYLLSPKAAPVAEASKPAVAQAEPASAAAPTPAPQGEPSPKGVAAPAPPPASPLKAYLDEAERLIQEGQFDPAQQMLGKAQEQQTDDTGLVIRRARLLAQVKRESLLAKGRMALQLEDAPKAIEAAKQVLDMEPTNAEALKLLMETKKTQATVARTSRSRQRQRQGTLNLTVEPVAMVYLNDEAIGLPPLRQFSLPQGNHRLEIRLEGYVPVKRTLQIQGNKATTLDLKLVRANPAQGDVPLVGDVDDRQQPNSLHSVDAP